MPHGIEIVEDCLSPEECRDWVRFAADRPSRPLGVIDWKASGPAEADKPDDRRVTDRVHMGDDRDQQLRDLMVRIYVSGIGPQLGRKSAWFESPQVLRYNVGGFYRSHADADSYEPERSRWCHHLDRDISVLLYLNDEFEGGELRFEYFDFRIRPKAGMLVWSPPTRAISTAPIRWRRVRAMRWSPGRRWPIPKSFTTGCRHRRRDSSSGRSPFGSF